MKIFSLKSRQSIFFDDGDKTITLLKPFSSYHTGKVIYIYEDAYGNINPEIMELEDFQKRFSISESIMKIIKNKLMKL